MASESSRGALVALEAMKGPVSWGDVPTWLGVVASVATLVAAVWAGVLAKRALSLEFARDRDRDEEARRDQASKVSAWIGIKAPPPQVPGDVRVIWSGPSLGVFVRNGSSEPIYLVELALHKDDELRGTHVLPGLTPPGEHFTRVPSEAYTTMTADRRGNEIPVDSLDETFMLEIQFTDARGRRWRRAIDGQLHLELDPV